MKRGLFFASIVIIAVGIWMIASGFRSTGPHAADAGPGISVIPVQSGNPVLLGMLLMAAGVLFVVVVSRRR